MTQGPVDPQEETNLLECDCVQDTEHIREESGPSAGNHSHDESRFSFFVLAPTRPEKPETSSWERGPELGPDVWVLWFLWSGFCFQRGEKISILLLSIIFQRLVLHSDSDAALTGSATLRGFPPQLAGADHRQPS